MFWEIFAPDGGLSVIANYYFILFDLWRVLAFTQSYANHWVWVIFDKMGLGIVYQAFIILIIKRPTRDACLCMGELQAPPAPHFVFLITL